ncbi:MAG: YdcF family protein [Ardenticatenaceae bacterium]|nr:YdcF family protein [Anaerolineales bacterium]MCB8939678.1 YdcF family protein [Ardenticatenaceae bacterium]MCB8974897.1 YdcF family protein [Ardenticatenaceae bacterium]
MKVVQTAVRLLARAVTIILALTVLLGWYAAMTVFLFSLRDETRPADAAIVLGAAVVRDRPSPVFRERINHAIQLYHDGTVPKLIFTGGVGNRDELAEAQVGRNYAIARGVDPADILIETSSTNTEENLRNAQMVARQHGLETFLIVSTPNHMRRALAVADDLNMQAYSSPTRSIRWINSVTRTYSYLREVVAFSVYLLNLG